MWRGYGKGSGSAAGKRSPVVAGPFRPPSDGNPDGSAYRNTNLWEPMTWLQYCGFKTSCPFKYKEYDLYKSIIIYLTKESFAHLWYRDVSFFDECDWLCVTLVLLCEWSGFLKQPLFGDEAGFSAAVIGAFLSSLSRGIVFRVVHHDENFQLFYGRTNVNLADVCVASTLLMQSAQFSGS